MTNVETRAEWTQRMLSRWCPGYESMEACFAGLVREHIRPDGVVLDAGCGEWGLINNFNPVTKKIVGVDISERAIKNNTTVDHGVVADLSQLPFADASFDLVTCQWVVEHLPVPSVSFKEFYRVLAKGGKLIILTTNLLNYEMMISKIVPNRYHAPLVQRFLSRSEGNTFPTYYRANTPRQLDKQLSAAGFRKLEMRLVGSPKHWRFSKPLFLSAIAYERITDLRLFNWGKVYIVCAYVKDTDNDAK